MHGTRTIIHHRMLNRFLRVPFLSILFVTMAFASACAYMPNRDPLSITVAGIESLPGEGMEMRLAVKVRIQNPNDMAVDYTGAALTLDLNGRKLASGVIGESGTVPRYGEAVMVIPVTVSAFDMARQVLGVATSSGQSDVHYRVRGKLEAGLFGTRRFSDEGMFQLDQPVEPGS
jgi:LEA14-like dessication related protein